RPLARGEGGAVRAGLRAALQGGRFQRGRHRPAHEQLDRRMVLDGEDEAAHPGDGEPSGDGAGGAATAADRRRRQCRRGCELELRQGGAAGVRTVRRERARRAAQSPRQTLAPARVAPNVVSLARSLARVQATARRGGRLSSPKRVTTEYTENTEKRQKDKRERKKRKKGRTKRK